MIELFFREIANARVTRDPLTFHVIGSTALMLQVPDYFKGTDDTDVLAVTEFEPSIKAELLALAGRRSALHSSFGLFLDIVGNGLPFLPHAPLWHAHAMEIPSFTVKVLDIVDVVVSKLKPYRPGDIDDITAMTRRGLVPHARLLERFEGAKLELAHDARARDLYKVIENLHEVERDLFGLEPTEIELPSWV